MDINIDYIGQKYPESFLIDTNTSYVWLGKTKRSEERSVGKEC